jgi:hypothetical protein
MRWTAQDVREKGPAYLETWFTELKSAYPALLAVEADLAIPADEQLLQAQAEASRLFGTKDKGEIWSFYQDRWQKKLLGSDQKILFDRLLRVVAAEAKEKNSPSAKMREAQEKVQKLEDEIRTLKAKKG